MFFFFTLLSDLGLIGLLCLQKDESFQQEWGCYMCSEAAEYWSWAGLVAWRQETQMGTHTHKGPCREIKRGECCFGLSPVKTDRRRHLCGLESRRSWERKARSAHYLSHYHHTHCMQNNIRVSSTGGRVGECSRTTMHTVGDTSCQPMLLFLLSQITDSCRLDLTECNFHSDSVETCYLLFRNCRWDGKTASVFFLCRLLWEMHKL